MRSAGFKRVVALLSANYFFLHLVCKTALEVGWYNMGFQVHAILTLQEAAEAYMVGLLECHSCEMCHHYAPKIYTLPSVSMENIFTIE